MKDLDIMLDELINCLTERDIEKAHKLINKSNNEMFKDKDFVINFAKSLDIESLKNLLDFTMICLMSNGYDCDELGNETSLMCKVFKLKEKGKI